MEQQWFPIDIIPKDHEWLIVKDIDGKEYKDYMWVGHAWYECIRDSDGYDGWRADMENIVAWRYE